MQELQGFQETEGVQYWGSTGGTVSTAIGTPTVDGQLCFEGHTLQNTIRNQRDNRRAKHENKCKGCRVFRRLKVCSTGAVQVGQSVQP